MQNKHTNTFLWVTNTTSKPKGKKDKKNLTQLAKLN